MSSPHRLPRFSRSLFGLLLASLLVLAPASARGHDPSAWGGLFRSRDDGATWFPANPGRFVSGALALAISPSDPNHLLLATDSGLLRSRNGGRDWDLEAPSVLVGPVFAVAFDRDGRRALVSTGAALVRADGGGEWRSGPTPSGAAPARALVVGAAPGRVYLAGWQGLYRSEEWGTSWTRVADELPEETIAALVADAGPPEVVYAVVGGGVRASSDGGRTWRPRDAGLPAGRVDALALDPREPGRMWAAGADRMFRSDDRGQRWEPVGRALPEAGTVVRGIAVATTGSTIVLATDRGLLRSADGGARWELMSDNLPAHLEAGPFVRDPVDASTLYAGFALTPYVELWRAAAEGRSALVRLDWTSLAGGAAFLLVLGLAAGAALRRLGRHYRPAHSRR